MTLIPIVRARGGDLYASGRRASIPAPGHSRHDRSASLLLGSSGRIVVHSFGGASVAEILADLRKSGLIDYQGYPLGEGRSAPSTPEPSETFRRQRAEALWTAGIPIRGTPSELYLKGHRAIARDVCLIAALRHHPAMPVAIYKDVCRYSRPALMSRIAVLGDRTTAVEVTYLNAQADRDRSLRISRKTVGCVPPGTFVQLDRPDEHIVVAEGVMTALSATERLGLPGLALLGIRNLQNFAPPTGVRRVSIAVDRGQAGESAAKTLEARLRDEGFEADRQFPRAPFEDFNRWAQAERALRKEEGREGMG